MAWCRHQHLNSRGYSNLALTFVAILFAGCQQAPQSPPYGPIEALATFSVAEGFRVDLVASEPLVMDPVAVAIDEHGRIYVVEMPGYPLDVGRSGRVKLLRDTDNDGMPDQATTFAEGLRLPTGIMRWKKGVIVTDPPEVLFLADSTGDDVADIREVLLSGFALSNPQHNANSPMYGLDNWIYIANNATISWTEKYADPFGDLGSEIYYPDHPEGPQLPPNGADRNVRFNPDRLKLENLSSKSQFGHSFDVWGRYFLVNNSHHHLHEVIPAHFFGQGELDILRDTRHSTPDHGDAAPVFPITINPEHQLLTDRGVFTSACALTFYKGGLFPAPYDQSVSFVAEPVHNLVHVDKVLTSGPTFTATRIEEGREFLASTDSWFRPVNFSHGPDGALYMVDYYRQIVEHPEWMDDSLATHGNLVRGTKMGRIYRIAPEDAFPMDWHDNISFGNTANLVQHLSSPNFWWRINAQRLLVDENNASAAPLLRDLLHDGRSPEGRLHALWTLEGLNSLTVADLTEALNDPNPGVRENAARIASRIDGMEEAFVTLAHDPNGHVRFEALGALGKYSSTEARQAQFEILWRDIDSEWVQIAALMTLKETPSSLLRRVLDRSDLDRSHREQLITRIATAAGLISPPEEIDAILAANIGNAAVLSGLAAGLGQRGATTTFPDASIDALVNLALKEDGLSEAIDVLSFQTLEDHLAIASRAVKIIQSSEAPSDLRARAIRILGLTAGHPEVLFSVLASSDSLAVRSAALRALGGLEGDSAAEQVLSLWSSFSPSLRLEALSIFNTNSRAALLVEALHEKQVLPEEIPWQYRVRLMRDTDEPIRSQARALLQLPPLTNSDIQVPDFQGDAMRGQEVFEQLCGMCHMAGSSGTGTLGPDLATVQHWPRKALLDKLINPNRSIASGYEQWIVERESGSTLLGVVASETPSVVTITTLTNTVTIPRTDIISIKALPSSAMPAGLVDALQPEDLADLLAFLTEN